MGKLSCNIRHWFRDLVYPGLDLHTRNRASLCQFWQKGPRDVLDAGSGNGYFSWLAYQSGARVVALNFDKTQVEKAREFLLQYKGADSTDLQIECSNLYRLTAETRVFDEIICYEVLEHVRRDVDVIRQFYRILKPGGVLHICCPYRLHPRHQAEVLDLNEAGGHVRPGYTEDQYRALLEPIGFQIRDVVGIGTPGIYRADRILRGIRNRLGDICALPFLPFTLPFVWLAKLNPRVPFSLYVRAVKPANFAVNRRVLIVTSSYAPSMIADMHRARQLAWELPKLGWQVEILSPNTAYQLRSCLDSDGAEFFAPDTLTHFVPQFWPALFRTLGFGSIGWRAIIPMFCAGRKLLRQRRFDLVYFSTTQFSLFLLGPVWQRQLAVPFVLDFHDPCYNEIAHPMWARPSLKHRISNWIAKYVERRAVTRAAAIVSVSPAYIDVLRRRYAERRPMWLETGRTAVIPFAAAPQRFGGGCPARSPSCCSVATARFYCLYRRWRSDHVSFVLTVVPNAWHGCEWKNPAWLNLFALRCMERRLAGGTVIRGIWWISPGSTGSAIW